MSGLSISERAHVARVSATEAGRRSMARLLGSPLVNWRPGSGRSQEVTLVPHNLRTADPSFATEIANGSFGLAGIHATTANFSPFDVTPPNAAWSRELHGFGWLRHLEADGTREATVQAQRLVSDWISREANLPDTANAPEVMGRRIISWLAASSILLDTPDETVFDRTLQSLCLQHKKLSSTWQAAPFGLPRLEAVMAVTYGDLCIAGHAAHLATSEHGLVTELSRQFLPDGGHVSRNVQVSVEVLLDLLPLRQCFLAANRPIPPAIEAAIARMMQMIRHMRLGDGSLARFNGAGVPQISELTSILAYDPAPMHDLAAADDSRYARLTASGTVLIVDTGTPPALELTGTTNAGCLSFEFSAGSCPVFLNGGRPHVAEPAMLAAARSTGTHNALVLADRSSAQLVRDPRLERLAGDIPLRMTGAVVSEITSVDGTPTLLASHEGYLADLGVVHTRRLWLGPDGSRLDGIDKLHGPRGTLRLARDLPFAIHFHIAPRAGASIDNDATISLDLADGSTWSFTADGATVSLEPGLHFADMTGIVRTRQIVLRGATFGETEVTWRLVRN